MDTARFLDSVIAILPVRPISGAAQLSSSNYEIWLADALVAEAGVEYGGLWSDSHFEVVLQRVGALCVFGWNDGAPQAAVGLHRLALPALCLIHVAVVHFDGGARAFSSELN